MLRILVSAVLIVATTAPLAARPSTLNMTCRQAQNLVQSRGAIVLSTGRNTYDRFVRSGRFCEVAEWAEDATAPTKDRDHCRLGYTCTSNPPIWYDRPGDHWFFGR